LQFAKAITQTKNCKRAYKANPRKEIIKNAPRATKKEKENRKNEKHKPLTKYKNT
jgi:hypothetical protein